MYVLNIIMSLSGLLNSNLILTIGVAMLMSGLVFYYCSSRFTVIEKGIQLQNKVLAEFIYNVQDELVKNKQLPSGPVTPGIASEKAVVSAETHTALRGVDKIEISDDEEEDTDTESETDDDDASVEEIEVDTETDNTKQVVVSDNTKQVVVTDNDVHLMDNLQSLMKNNMMDVKVISMSCDTDVDYEDISKLLERRQSNAFQSNAFQSNAFQSNAFQSNAFQSITEVSNVEIVSSDSEDSLSDVESIHDDVKITEVKEIKVEKKDAFELLTNNVDYKKMSLAELKDLVVERGLAINGNYKKMKKGELIDLLMK